MTDVILFAIGSPIAIDAVESCKRRNWRIVAAIRNYPGQDFVGPGLPVIESTDIGADLADIPFVVPLFAPANRRQAQAEALKLGLRRPAMLADPTSIVAESAQLSAGCYINAGCILAGDVRLGASVMINRGANLGHHCRISDFASIGPGAILSGSVVVGEGASIGSGAIILPKVVIGAHARIAPGAVVARDVPEGGFAAGNPARIRAAMPPAGDDA